MEQFLQLFRQTMEQVLSETLATNAEFIQRLRELQESGDQRLDTVLRYVENASRGQTSGTALPQNVLSQLSNLTTQSAENIIREMNLRGASNIANTLESGDATKIARLEDSLGLYGTKLVDATGTWLDQIEQMNNAIDRYNQAVQEEADHFANLGTAGKMIWAMNSWRTAQEQYRRDFWQDVRNYQQANLVGEDVAIGAIRQQYMDRGIATASFLDPTGQPGGSAAVATDRQRFIKQLVSAIAQSEFGKRLSNIVSEGATMLSLAIASNAPPWLQKTILGAIALGIPQSLGPLLVNLPLTIMNLMSTRFGRLMLGRGVQALGNLAGSSAVAGGASLLGGLLGGKLLLNGLGWATDKLSGGRQAGADMVKALTGALVAGLSVALISFGTVTGVVPVCLAIGAGVAGLWHLFQHLGKWWKEKDDNPGWFARFTNWLQEHMHLPKLFGGGNGDSTSSTVSLGDRLTKSAKDQEGKDLFGHRITSGYGYRVHPSGTGSKVDGKKHFHKGIDLAYSEGETVSANVGGTIEKVLTEAQSGGYGNTVYVRDQFGVLHQYSHLQGFGDKIEAGAKIGKDDVIGYAGHTGFATGAHLHYEVSEKGKTKDPVEYAQEYERKLKEQENKGKTRDLKNIPAEIRSTPPKTYISGQRNLVDSTNLNRTITRN